VVGGPKPGCKLWHFCCAPEFGHAEKQMKYLFAFFASIVTLTCGSTLGLGSEHELKRITYGDMKLQDTTRYKFGYEWWYFDASNEKTGEELTIAFIVHNPFEPRYYRFLLQDGSKFSDVFIHYSNGKGKSWEIEEQIKQRDLIQYHPLHQYADEDENFEYIVQMGPNSVHFTKREGELPKAEVTLDVYDKKKDLSAKAHLFFNGTFNSHKVKAPLTYIKNRPFGLGKRKLFHEWATSMPRAETNGDIQIREANQNWQSFQLKGARGYADKQWGSGPISMSFKGWYWGRLETPDYTFIYWDGQHPERRGLMWRWVPEHEYNLLLAIDKSGIIYETYDAQFDYSGETRLTQRGLPYREAHSISTPELINGKPAIKIDVRGASPVMSKASFYARFSALARLNSPDFLKVEEDEYTHKLDFEVMDLKRATRFMLCSAFTPWLSACQAPAKK
jgi:hypothetical protein